ncbi:alpha/beta fold hydrolase [Isoptericola aurantiacus]|uniref:alpha/beta fold hydrolase n=1 Tax=Isoptericola aurantiacus TaxID=3377839 RepID=UPI00383BA635
MTSDGDDAGPGVGAADGEALGPEQYVEQDGVRLCFQAVGAPERETVLLIGGLGAAMDWCPADFCVALADGGRRVVRYDHRDTGRSSTGSVGEPAYTARDLVEDPVRILDALEVEQAHLVGFSMGGGIAQELAVERRDRVASVTLVSTSPALDRADPAPLQGPAPELAGLWEGPAPGPGEDAAVEASVREDRLLTAGGRFDEARTRAIARRAVRRSIDPAASVNHADLAAETPVRGALRDLRVPALVVHGDRDPLFPGHGERLAAEIPGAELLELDRTGHQFPPPQTWERLLPVLLEHTARRRRTLGA